MSITSHDIYSKGDRIKAYKTKANIFYVSTIKVKVKCEAFCRLFFVCIFLNQIWFVLIDLFTPFIVFPLFIFVHLSQFKGYDLQHPYLVLFIPFFLHKIRLLLMEIQVMTQHISYRRKVFFLAQSTVLMSLMLFATQNHAEQYYKWVDNTGSTHYTTTPPPKGSKKQGQVKTYGHTPQPTPNNESSNSPNDNKNSPHSSPMNMSPQHPQDAPKPEPTVSSSANRAAV